MHRAYARRLAVSLTLYYTNLYYYWNLFRNENNMINVKVTTFKSPFSFFCICEDAATNLDVVVEENNNGLHKFDLVGASHGQYVAVMWNNNWARGIVTCESQVRIWLVDYGIYIRAHEKTVFIDLPSEYKKYPTKIFEASIHGVNPVEKVLTDQFELESVPSSTWCQGSVAKANELLARSEKTYFIPLALLSTKCNDVVIGDLYLKIKGKGIVSLADELEDWPVLLYKNPEMYIAKLSQYYTCRRQHRASLKKPAFPDVDLPTVTFELTLPDYTAICANRPEFVFSEVSDSAGEGSTITFIEKPNRNDFKLTPSEIAEYSNISITVAGREYNMLNVLMNKARDLYMCEKYKDMKSLGRANSRIYQPTSSDVGDSE